MTLLTLWHFLLLCQIHLAISGGIKRGRGRPKKSPKAGKEISTGASDNDSILFSNSDDIAQIERLVLKPNHELSGKEEVDDKLLHGCGPLSEQENNAAEGLLGLSDSSAGAASHKSCRVKKSSLLQDSDTNLCSGNLSHIVRTVASSGVSDVAIFMNAGSGKVVTELSESRLLSRKDEKSITINQMQNYLANLGLPGSVIKMFSETNTNV